MSFDKIWNGKLGGILGAACNIQSIIISKLWDLFATIIKSRNMKAAGSDVVIQRRVTIRYPGKISLGNKVRIAKGVSLGSETDHGYLEVGDETWINRDCSIDFSGGLLIGKRCMFSEGVRIYTHNHSIDPRGKPVTRQLKIGDEVWVGANAIILGSVSEIGDGSIIGAGAIVTRDVKKGQIVAGNPAGEIRQRS